MRTILSTATAILIMSGVALFTSCTDANRPHRTNAVVLQEGCYISGDTACAVVFPDGQHDGLYVGLAYTKDSVTDALRPELVVNYNDSAGTGALHVMDRMIGLRTNGGDSLWLTADTDAQLLIRQPEVDYAPKSLTGTWRLSYPLNAFVSIPVMDAVVADDLHCDVMFNIPDSTQLATMMEAAGMQDDFSDFLDMMAAGMTGDVWYSPYAGTGVFVLDMQGVVNYYGVFFTTPDARTIRLFVASYSFDLTRVK